MAIVRGEFDRDQLPFPFPLFESLSLDTDDNDNDDIYRIPWNVMWNMRNMVMVMRRNNESTVRGRIKDVSCWVSVKLGIFSIAVSLSISMSLYLAGVPAIPDADLPCDCDCPNPSRMISKNNLSSASISDVSHGHVESVLCPLSSAHCNMRIMTFGNSCWSFMTKKCTHKSTIVTAWSWLVGILLVNVCMKKLNQNVHAFRISMNMNVNVNMKGVFLVVHVHDALCGNITCTVWIYSCSCWEFGLPVRVGLLGSAVSNWGVALPVSSWIPVLHVLVRVAVVPSEFVSEEFVSSIEIDPASLSRVRVRALLLIIIRVRVVSVTKPPPIGSKVSNDSPAMRWDSRYAEYVQS